MMKMNLTLAAVVYLNLPDTQLLSAPFSCSSNNGAWSQKKMTPFQEELKDEHEVVFDCFEIEQQGPVEKLK